MPSLGPTCLLTHYCPELRLLCSVFYSSKIPILSTSATQTPLTSAAVSWPRNHGICQPGDAEGPQRLAVSLVSR